MASELAMARRDRLEVGLTTGRQSHQFSRYPKISGATMDASDSMMNRGVVLASFSHEIFSLGTAPEYEPYDVVESEIWQK